MKYFKRKKHVFYVSRYKASDSLNTAKKRRNRLRLSIRRHVHLLDALYLLGVHVDA